MTHLASNLELDLDELTWHRFAELVLARDLEHVASDSWPTERMTLEGVHEHALSTLRDSHERAAVRDIGDDCLVHLSQRSWCRLHYVTDPETFFGQPRYMLDVLLEEPEDGERDLWRLLVLEDTGELLVSDAKERTGQGLSRLLNVVDGLIGQGLRLLVLVTTNEVLRRLHPAVARPGRCEHVVEFTAFTAEEAAAWLERHGSDAAAGRSTLASLYARAAGIEPPRKHPLGFTA